MAFGSAAIAFLTAALSPTSFGMVALPVNTSFDHKALTWDASLSVTFL